MYELMQNNSFDIGKLTPKEGNHLYNLLIKSREREEKSLTQNSASNNDEGDLFSQYRNQTKNMQETPSEFS
jgi:hypothetical protein